MPLSNQGPKVVLVTGGSSGIGRSICQELAGRGCKVYGTSRKAKPGDTLDNFQLLPMDITDLDSVQTAIDQVLEAEGRLDVLVNNAGLGMIGPLEETPMEQIEVVMDTNVNGAIRATQVALPYMRKQGGGYIINIGSIGGVMGLPFRGIYSATKFAIEGWSEALRMETLQHGIKVIILEPGDFKTNINNNRESVTLKADSVYKEAYDGMHKRINEEVSNAADPALVGKLVWRLIHKRNPKPRYRVGTTMQKLAIYLKRILPGLWFEAMLRRFYRT